MPKAALLPLLLLTAPALQAQDPHMGMSLGILLPTGKFQSHTFGPTVEVPDALQTEGYDIGIGGQFNVSIPLDRHLALRLNLGAFQTQGSNTAPTYPRMNLRHSLFSVGGELQFFFQSAYRHRGTYLFGGLHAHFERKEASEGEIDYDYTQRTSRSHGAYSAGIGHTFGLDSGFRLTFEAAYRRSLERNASPLDRPAAEFTTLSMGFLF